MLRLLITGSSGFVGRHLVEFCKQAGFHVQEADEKKGMDLTDRKVIQKFECFDVMIHLAAVIARPESKTPYNVFYGNNVEGTRNALELCRIHKAKMIYISSYVYGKPQYLPIDENHPVFSFNYYSKSKILAENLCKEHAREHGLPVIIVRPFNLYGCRMADDLLIPTILKGALKGKITVNDLKPRRDYLYIKDFLTLLAHLIEFTPAKSNYEIFNAGSGVSYSVQEVISIVKSYLKEEVEVVCRSQKRENEILEVISDISKAGSFFDWNPKTSFKNGIKEMIQCYKGSV